MTKKEILTVLTKIVDDYQKDCEYAKDNTDIISWQHLYHERMLAVENLKKNIEADKDISIVENGVLINSEDCDLIEQTIRDLIEVKRRARNSRYPVEYAEYTEILSRSKLTENELFFAIASLINEKRILAYDYEGISVTEKYSSHIKGFSYRITD